MPDRGEPSAPRRRLAAVRAAGRASLFLRQMRYPTRASAIRAVIDCVFVAFTLKKRGVRPLLTSNRGVPPTHDPDRSIQVSYAVDAGIALVPIAPTCLRRSVTLVRELGRLGLAANLHIGVRNEAGRVEAHAWVQTGDVVVNDDPEVTSTYVELASGEIERLLPLLG